MRVMVRVLAVLAVLALSGCQAAMGLGGLKAADLAAHATGAAALSPGADEALHRKIEELEAMDPEAELGWEEWLKIAGTVIAGGFGLNAVRNKKYTKPPVA